MSGYEDGLGVVAGPAGSWRVRPGWQYVRSVDGLHFYNDVRHLRVVGPDDLIYSVVGALQGRRAVGADNEVRRVIVKLADQGVVSESPALIERGIQYFSPNLSQAAYFEGIGVDPAVAFMKLAASDALIVGVGGIGSVVLQHLVGAGMRRFVLVDFDLVEESNLGRQFTYSRDAIGRRKVEAAAEYVSRRVENADLQQRNIRIGSEADIDDILGQAPEVDMAAICIDTPPGASFDLCARPLWRAGIPFVHGGLMTQSGFFGPLFAAEHDSPPPTHFSLPSWRASRLEACFAPYNTVVAACMAAALIHHVIGAHDLVEYRRRTLVDWFRGCATRMPGSPPATGH